MLSGENLCYFIAWFFTFYNFTILQQIIDLQWKSFLFPFYFSSPVWNIISILRNKFVVNKKTKMLCRKWIYLLLCRVSFFCVIFRILYFYNVITFRFLFTFEDYFSYLRWVKILICVWFRAKNKCNRSRSY